MAVPELSLRAIRRFFRQPTAVTGDQEVRVDVTVRGNYVTIWEGRRPLDEPEWPPLRRVAQLRFAPDDGSWSLYWWDGRGHWHPWDERGQR